MRVNAKLLEVALDLAGPEITGRIVPHCALPKP